MRFIFIDYSTGYGAQEYGLQAGLNWYLIKMTATKLQTWGTSPSLQ